MHVWFASANIRCAGPLVLIFEVTKSAFEIVLQTPANIKEGYILLRIFHGEQDGGKAVALLSNVDAPILYPMALDLDPLYHLTLKRVNPWDVLGQSKTYSLTALASPPPSCWVGGHEYSIPENMIGQKALHVGGLVVRAFEDNAGVSMCKSITDKKWQKIKSMTPTDKKVRNLFAPYGASPPDAAIPGTTFLFLAPYERESHEVLLRATINAAARQGVLPDQLEILLGTDDRVRFTVFLELLQSVCTHAKYLEDSAYDSISDSRRLVERYSNDVRLLKNGDCEDLAKESHMLFCALRDMDASMIPPILLSMREVARCFVAMISFMGARNGQLGREEDGGGGATMCHCALILIRGDQFDRASYNGRITASCPSKNMGCYPKTAIIEGTNVKAMHDTKGWELRPDASRNDIIDKAMNSSRSLRNAIKTYRTETLTSFYREVTYVMTSDAKEKSNTIEVPVTDFYISHADKPNTYGCRLEEFGKWVITPICVVGNEVDMVRLALRSAALEQPLPPYPEVMVKQEAEEFLALRTKLGKDNKGFVWPEYAGPVVLLLEVARLLFGAFECGACRFVRDDIELKAFAKEPSFFLSEYDLRDEATAGACARMMMTNKPKIWLARIDRPYEGFWGVQILLVTDQELYLSLNRKRLLSI